MGIVLTGHYWVKVFAPNAVCACVFVAVYKHSRSAGLIEDEAGRIFNSRLLDDLGLLNKVWDGRNVTVDRRSESFFVAGPRATISWMVQPHIFNKYMERKGDAARGIGFFARCLVSYPQSNQGWRFELNNSVEGKKIDAFRCRVLTLLHGQIDLLMPTKSHDETESSYDEKIELSFSSEAQREWVNIFNQVEASIQPGGAFCQNRDYASKIAENIARVAGVMHAFEGYAGTEISKETLQSATTIVLWYAAEFLRLFSPPDPLSELVVDATLIDGWLTNLVKTRGMVPQMDLGLLLQYGPNSLRQKDRLLWALQYLQDKGRLLLHTYLTNKGRNRKNVIQLNDAYYGNLSRGVQPFGQFMPLN